MRKFYLLFTAFLRSLFSFSQKKLIGFTDSSGTKQTEWEKMFDAQLNAQNLDTWMKHLTAHPHHVGSPQDRANPDYLANLFKQCVIKLKLRPTILLSAM